jgi:hypothetical protein
MMLCICVRMVRVLRVTSIMGIIQINMSSYLLIKLSVHRGPELVELESRSLLHRGPEIDLLLRDWDEVPRTFGHDSRTRTAIKSYALSSSCSLSPSIRLRPQLLGLAWLLILIRCRQWGHPACHRIIDANSVLSAISHVLSIIFV